MAAGHSELVVKSVEEWGQVNVRRGSASSGVYFARLEEPGRVSSKRITLVK